MRFIQHVRPPFSGGVVPQGGDVRSYAVPSYAVPSNGAVPSNAVPSNDIVLSNAVSPANAVSRRPPFSGGVASQGGAANCAYCRMLLSCCFPAAFLLLFSLSNATVLLLCVYVCYACACVRVYYAYASVRVCCLYHSFIWGLGCLYIVGLLHGKCILLSGLPGIHLVIRGAA